MILTLPKVARKKHYSSRQHINKDGSIHEKFFFSFIFWPMQTIDRRFKGFVNFKNYLDCTDYLPIFRKGKKSQVISSAHMYFGMF
jgi:hypothetical protein